MKTCVAPRRRCTRLVEVAPSLGETHGTQKSPGHQFDDLVDEVHRRDGGSRAAAMTTARQENPRRFASYQRFHATGAAQEQGTARGYTTGLHKLGLPKHAPLAPNSEDQELQASGQVKAKSHRRR